MGSAIEVRLRDPEPGAFRLIPLTRGLFATVDEADFAALSAHRWHAAACNSGKFYARRSKIRKGVRQIIWMHRELVAPSVGEDIDHRDGDSLNNRRGNLRSVSRSVNIRNSSNAIGRGSCLCPDTGRYFARASLDGRRVFLGRFIRKDEAQAAVDSARTLFDQGTHIDDIIDMFRARARWNLYSAPLDLRSPSSPYPLENRHDG